MKFGIVSLGRMGSSLASQAIETRHEIVVREDRQIVGRTKSSRARVICCIEISRARQVKRGTRFVASPG